MDQVNINTVYDLPVYNVDPNCHKIQWDFDHRGMVTYIPHPRFLLRNTLRAMWRLKNKVREALYPIPVTVAIALNAFAVWRVMRNPTSRTGLFLTRWCHRFPGVKRLPPQLQIAYVTFNMSSVVLFSFTFLQRTFLRQLLSYSGWAKEGRGPKSWKTKVFGALLKYVYLRGKRPLLLMFQSCLPTLPLPALETTVSKYLVTMKPLLPTEEYTALEADSAAFMANEAPKLQRALRMKHMISSNYITDWWIDCAYLRGRDSLTINSNYFCIGRLHAPPTPRQASRAAKIVQLFVRSKLEIDHEVLPPQLIQGIIPICMHQYVSAFSTTREPHRVKDQLVTYDSLASRHIVVLHKGRIFYVDCFSQRSRRPLTAKQLERTLTSILEDTSVPDAIESAIPVLTSLDRDTWADVRRLCFTTVPGNQTALEAIEKALFVLALDDVEPTNLNEEGLNYFIGDLGKNRWVDKSFHVIVTKNAKVGIEAEHAWGDAPALGHIFELAMAREVTEEPYDENGFVKMDARDVKKMKENRNRLYPARRLRFVITPQLAQAVRDAIPKVGAELSTLNYECLFFEEYGRAFMKKAGAGPDQWTQMALQLAYYLDQNRFDQTYESAMTRLFHYGRTETIRTVSQYTCDWVRMMCDKSNTNNEEKINAFRIACEAHQNQASLASIGEGIDRHLFALYIASVGLGIPSPFLQAFIKRKWLLSTSQVLQRQTVPGTWPGNDTGDLYPLPSGGFGPVCTDGYGVCYCFVGEYRVSLHVTSRRGSDRTDTQRFVKNLEKALRMMRDLFPKIPDMPLPKAAALAKGSEGKETTL